MTPDAPAADRRLLLSMLRYSAEHKPLDRREADAARVLRFVAQAPNDRRWGDGAQFARGTRNPLRFALDEQDRCARFGTFVAKSKTWELNGSPVDPDIQRLAQQADHRLRHEAFLRLPCGPLLTAFHRERERLDGAHRRGEDWTALLPARDAEEHARISSAFQAVGGFQAAWAAAVLGDDVALEGFRRKLAAAVDASDPCPAPAVAVKPRLPMDPRRRGNGAKRRAAKSDAVVPARPVGGDLRLPLPLAEMRALLTRSHGSLVARLVELGWSHDDLWAEVSVGFLGKTKGYDATKMRRADSFVVAAGKGVLLNILERTSREMRLPGGQPEVLGVPTRRRGMDVGAVVDAAVYASESMADAGSWGEDDDETPMVAWGRAGIREEEAV